MFFVCLNKNIRSSDLPIFVTWKLNGITVLPQTPGGPILQFSLTTFTQVECKLETEGVDKNIVLGAATATAERKRLNKTNDEPF